MSSDLPETRRRWASSRMLEPMEAEPVFRPLWTGDEGSRETDALFAGRPGWVDAEAGSSLTGAAALSVGEPEASMGKPGDGALSAVTPETGPVREEPDPAVLSREREAGHAEGRAAALAELKAAADEERHRWRELCGALSMQLKDSQNFVDPLARLALHFASLLARTELQASEASIRALVSACLAELGGAFAGAKLFLNPEDLAQVRASVTPLVEGISVLEDATLSRGSVRLVCGDAVIEDLAARRFEELARSVLADQVQPIAANACAPLSEADRAS